jgi:hypothetical protein
MGTKKNDMGVYDHSDIKRGDIVIVAGNGFALRSGGCWYPFAICAGTEPRLTLVSEEGDMLWSATLPDMPLRAIGRATPEQMQIVDRRYQATRKEEREAEVKTALASINIVYRACWTEYEHDQWASQRADGVSYAVEKDKLLEHIERIEKLGSPQCYSRANKVEQAIVTPEFYAEIQAAKTGVIKTLRHDHEGMLGVFEARK